jgi:hypothetical protein
LPSLKLAELTSFTTMNDDNKILLFSFLIFWGTLFLLTIKSKNWKRTLILNLPIHILYSSYFLYGLVYKSLNGTALAWWFYLLIIIALHWLLNLATLVIGQFKKKPLMKRHLKKFLYFLALILHICFSACMQNATFSNDELRFLKPFLRTDTAIYQSSTGLIDTILFHQAMNDTAKVRSIEQGFYNNNRLLVSYELTNNSYHKFTVKAVNNEPENFIQFTKAKGSHQSKEIRFLGMVFSQEYLNKLNVKNKNKVTFNVNNATYNEVNINEGIKSFVFDFDKGITSFIDIKNIKWEKEQLIN